MHDSFKKYAPTLIKQESIFLILQKTCAHIGEECVHIILDGFNSVEGLYTVFLYLHRILPTNSIFILHTYISRALNVLIHFVSEQQYVWYRALKQISQMGICSGKLIAFNIFALQLKKKQKKQALVYPTPSYAKAMFDVFTLTQTCNNLWSVFFVSV